jgi:hypothetical protein
MKGFEFENPLAKTAISLGVSLSNPECGEVRLRAEPDDCFSISCGSDLALWLYRKLIQGCLDRNFGKEWKHFETTECHRVEREGSVFKRSKMRLRELQVVFVNGDTRFIRCKNGKLVKTILKKKKIKKTV